MYMNLEIMFHFCMMMGVIMAISSNTWFSIWVGLELSLMCFIPIMSNKLKLNSESCIKYFIIQSLSSSVLMMGVILTSMEINQMKMMLMMAILLKLGVSPLHTWVLSIIEGMKYYSIFIMLTLMKLPPLTLISYNNLNLNFIIMASLITGAISGLNQNSIKKIFSYSSIFNMAFMISCINTNTIWLTYFILYSLSLMLMNIIVMKLNINFINQLILNKFNSPLKLSSWMTMLSMGGFPPLMGFFSKMIIIKQVLIMNNLLILTMMIMSSLIIMFFYMRMTFLSMMLYMNMPKWMMIKFNFNSYMIISSLLLPMLLFNLKSI
uniref:NADH-ubiquinone oxidoreductase chain 2 n=1 Tax=Leptocentrus albolineatus TaxID=2605028 RepID=A0A5B9T3X3_9HEMI|nr:NADH dehydrogenase subunit 2 [Leptocentrus albolineatus]QEG98457.1 NADH dehydrogenase subunit 2 [Leptocentrus albolineatus]